jgi:hypothetical protein
MISICLTIKNRSRLIVDGSELQLFPKCVKSIVDSVSDEIPCELIVADYNSDDWPLNEWLPKAVGTIPVSIIPVSGGFSRGRGLNIAASAATGNKLLFADADCLLCPGIFRRGEKYLRQGKAYFPVLYSFDSPSHKSGWWRHEGYGISMVTKTLFDQVEGWPEYEVWGKEDDHFYGKIKAYAEIVREEVEGFYHQWHPNDVVWKNQYAERAAEIAHEIEQVTLAKQELMEIIPACETVILVDETRFGDDAIHNCKTLPFTEVNGEYGGPPTDSEAAILEFERLRLKGVSFIVFAWMAFWWLEHYLEFQQYLERKFDCILKNDRLVIFNLESVRS